MSSSDPSQLDPCKVCLDPHCEANNSLKFGFSRSASDRSLIYSFVHHLQNQFDRDRNENDSAIETETEPEDISTERELLTQLQRLQRGASSEGSRDNAEAADSASSRRGLSSAAVNCVNPVTVVRWMYDRLSLAKDPISIIERIITDHQCLHRWIGLVTKTGVTVQDGDLKVSLDSE